MTDRQVYLLPFSHLDLFWAGEELECLSRGSRIIARTLQMCRRDPHFRFLLEDVVFIEYFLRNHPESKDELRQLIQNGQIAIGPKWAGIHQSIQLGEDLIRNIIYGTAYTRQELGVESPVMHLGDLPSWTPQFPQIAAGLGVRYVISTRCGPGDTPLFYWQAPDGSQVLTWYAIRGYHWGWSRKFHSPDADWEALQNDMAALSRLTPGPLLLHWGIDLVLPEPEIGARVEAWNQRATYPLTMVTPEEYFTVAEKTPNLPVLEGDAPSLWPYLESMNTQMTPLDIPAEVALIQAETFCSLAFALGLRRYPKTELAQSWRRLLQVMDHNYPATGADDTRWRKRAYHTQAIEVGRWLAEDSLHQIAEQVRVPELPVTNLHEVIPIVVFNSLGWNRQEPVLAHVTYHGDIHAMEVGRYRRIRLLDEAGATVPFQQVDIREGVCREDTLLFTANVPSLGYRTYYVVPEGSKAGTGFGPVLPESGATPQSLPPVVQQERDIYLSAYYQLQVDATTGEVTVRDREQRLVLDRARLVALEEKPGNMTFRDQTTGRLFENVISSVRLVENGPVRARIVISGQILSSPVQQEIMLYANSPRMDIVDHIDWQDEQPLRLQQLFPTGFSQHQVEYGVPFGVSSSDYLMPGSGPLNPDELPRESWKRLRECIYWLDVTAPDTEQSLFIASDRRSFEVATPTIACNILRMARSNFEVHVEENRLNRVWRGQLGPTTARFSLYPHTGNWRAELLHRHGWEFNHPLWCVSSNDMESRKTLAPEFSLIHELGPGMVVSALKQAEVGNDLVLRFYESLGQPGQARLVGDTSPRLVKEEESNAVVQVAELIDMQEQSLTAQKGQDEGTDVGAYQIRTVRLQVGGGAAS